MPWVGFLWCSAVCGEDAFAVSYIYTEAPRYDGSATLKGAERFPAGAALQLVSNGRKRLLAPGFAASADAAVSFDGQRVLFSGKQKPSDPWQIWEIPVAGGTSHRIVPVREDAIAPFYLPGERIVYARRLAGGYRLMTVGLDGGAPLQLTYSPGNHVPCDVLKDGRILFEAAHPAGAAARELYTVYADGSGVETYRCDHGRDRHAGRELASGDIVFETAGRPARFTSARAVQLPVPMPSGEFAGPAAEIALGDWLISFRPDPAAAYGLYRWRQSGQATPAKIMAAAGQALQPVLVQSHAVPKRHPSGLGDRDGANLLCLNVYTSKLRIPEGSVAQVRVWALDDRGAPVMMGQAPVERDGSFFVQPPSERAIRFELVDRAGKTLAAEEGWFWARRGEQRVCVGCHAGPERAPENAVPEVLNRSTEPVRMRLPVHGTDGGAK